MISILRLFIDLCLLRITPDVVPASSVLFFLSLLAYLFSGVLLVVPSLPLAIGLGQASLDATVLLGTIFVALAVYGHRPRFMQTATAAAGTGVLLNLLALPLVFWVNANSEASQGVQLPSFFLLALMIWSLLVISHIIRASLGSSRGLSMALTVTYFVTSVMLNQILFPVVS